MLKKLILFVFCAASLSVFSGVAKADGCYMCKGGTFVKYTGDDNQTKRKAAEACGCEIGGTRGDCSAANLKVLCTVKNDLTKQELLACNEKKANKSEEEENRRN